MADCNIPSFRYNGHIYTWCGSWNQWVNMTLTDYDRPVHDDQGNPYEGSYIALTGDCEAKGPPSNLNPTPRGVSNSFYVETEGGFPNTISLYFLYKGQDDLIYYATVTYYNGLKFNRDDSNIPYDNDGVRITELNPDKWYREGEYYDPDFPDPAAFKADNLMIWEGTSTELNPPLEAACFKVNGRVYYLHEGQYWYDITDKYPFIGGDVIAASPDDFPGDSDYGRREDQETFDIGTAYYVGGDGEDGPVRFLCYTNSEHHCKLSRILEASWMGDGIYTRYYDGYFIQDEDGHSVTDVNYSGPIYIDHGDDTAYYPIAFPTIYSKLLSEEEPEPEPEPQPDTPTGSTKIYRRRGSRLDPIAVMDKDVEWNTVANTPMGYNKQNDTLVPLKDMSLNSINVVDRIVVEGISYLNGDVIADKNVSVHGDLIVDGTTYTTEEQSLDTTSDYVVLRHSNPSGLSNTEKAGIVVNNYNGTKHAALAVDNDGIWRVSDNETESTTTYTNFSKFGDVYYEGFDQTTVKTVITNGATVARDTDELSDCVYYNDHYYYHDNVDWFLLELVNNRMSFDVDSPIADSDLIAILDGLTKQNLEYYRTVTILTISDVTPSQVVATYPLLFSIKTGDSTRYFEGEESTSYGVTKIKLLIDSEVVVDGVYDSSDEEVTLTTTYELADYEGKLWRYWSSESGWTYVTGGEYVIGAASPLNIIIHNGVIPDSDGLYSKLESLNSPSTIRFYRGAKFITPAKQNNQPLLTRAESEDLVDGAPLVWSADDNKAITTATTDGNKVLKSVKNTTTGKVTYEWASSGSGAVWTGTRAELTAALLIVDPNDERYIPDNAMLIVTDNETVYLHGEVEENE